MGDNPIRVCPRQLEQDLTITIADTQGGTTQYASFMDTIDVVFLDVVVNMITKGGICLFHMSE